MRVVFVSYEYPPLCDGGIGEHVAVMSRALVARGHHVTVVSTTDAAYPQREVTDDGWEIIRVPVGAASLATDSRRWAERSVRVAEILDRIAVAETPDVIEFADYRGEGVAFLEATEPGARPLCVVRLHMPSAARSVGGLDRDGKLGTSEFEVRALVAADRLVCSSVNARRRIERSRSDLGPIDVLPGPADGEALAAGRPSPAGESDIVCAVEHEAHDGVETVLLAAPRFLDACPGATLHFVRHIATCNALSSVDPSPLHLPRTLRDRVLFHGATSWKELDDRLRRARVCVFPSPFESISRGCLQALSLGKPIIASDASCLSELVEDGESCVLVPNLDDGPLSDAVERLWHSSDAKLEQMGRAAQHWVTRNHHPSVIARRYEDLYASCVPPAGSRGRVSLGAMVGHDPEVAFVIPCFNHGKYLPDALESIQAQDWPRVDCVVVDDGSTGEETRRVLDRVEAGGVRVVRQAHRGLASARNAGVRATTAPFFVCLDADDRVAPSFTSTLLQRLLQDATLGYCYSHAAFFGTASGVWECPAYDPHRLIIENLSTATAVVRRGAFDLVGGYAEDMTHGFEDWDFWIALLAVGFTGTCVAESLFHYRRHPHGTSMLDEAQLHRDELVRRMIRHHHALFASMLGQCAGGEAVWRDVADPDIHISQPDPSALDREGVPDRCGSLHQAWRDQAELSAIETSRSWHMVEQLGRGLLGGALTRVLCGAGWRKELQAGGASAAERLRCIKRSRLYRGIEAGKRLWIYRRYAARKYASTATTRR